MLDISGCIITVRGPKKSIENYRWFSYVWSERPIIDALLQQVKVGLIQPSLFGFKNVESTARWKRTSSHRMLLFTPYAVCNLHFMSKICRRTAVAVVVRSVSIGIRLRRLQFYITSLASDARKTGITNSTAHRELKLFIEHWMLLSMKMNEFVLCWSTFCECYVALPSIRLGRIIFIIVKYKRSYEWSVYTFFPFLSSSPKLNTLLKSTCQ